MVALDQSEFKPANRHEADPVGTIGSEWGFWDEVWMHWHGGFHSEEEARVALLDYAQTL